jgi:Protein of unknown function (DUF3421)
MLLGCNHHMAKFCQTLCQVSIQTNFIVNNSLTFLLAGRTASGETLYVGRAWHMGALTPGKIQPSHGNLYIPYNGGEVALATYELLIEN